MVKRSRKPAQCKQGQKGGEVTVSVLLVLMLIIAGFAMLVLAAYAVVPTIVRFVNQMAVLLVKVISMAFTVVFVVLVVTAFVAHGKLA